MSTRRKIAREIDEILEADRTRRSSGSLVDGYVSKYMNILGIEGDPPVVKIRDNLGSRWLGRSTWLASRPRTTLLELQRSVVGDERTLERVVAHEMIHHRDALAISRDEVALLRVGIRPESHGATFREGAARVNAIMGPDFVTATSDRGYEQTSSVKKFAVLITPLPGGRLGWTWASRLGPKAADWANELVARGSRLVHATDERWTRGRRIERYGGYSMPGDDEDAALLRELYDS